MQCYTSLYPLRYLSDDHASIGHESHEHNDNSLLVIQVHSTSLYVARLAQLRIPENLIMVIWNRIALSLKGSQTRVSCRRLAWQFGAFLPILSIKVFFEGSFSPIPGILSPLGCALSRGVGARWRCGVCRFHTVQCVGSLRCVAVCSCCAAVCFPVGISLGGNGSFLGLCAYMYFIEYVISCTLLMSNS